MSNEIDLLIPVDWNEWRKRADAQANPISPTPSRASIQTTIKVDNVHHVINDAERIALMVLNMNRPRDDIKAKHMKKLDKRIRQALRDIEQTVLTAEQDIEDVEYL